MRLLSAVLKISRGLVPCSLNARFLLLLLAPMILLQTVTVTVFYYRHWNTVMRRLAHDLAGDVSAALELRTTMDDDAWFVPFARRTMGLTVEERPGAILNNAPYVPSNSIEDIMAGALAERIRRPFRVDVGFRRAMARIEIQTSEGVTVFTTSRKRLFSITTYIFVLLTVGVTLILIGITVPFMSNQVRSIRRLAASADSFGKGCSPPPLKLEGAREVRQAARAFNLMRERIERQIAQRSEMLAGVSHDLRTPLTRMKLQLKMKLEADDIANLEEDILEMERMIDGYLAFVRGEAAEPVTEVDLTAMVRSLALRIRNDGGKIAICADTAASTIIPLRRQAIERTLRNVFHNAIQYAHMARVSVRAAHPFVEVIVEDDGPGVSEANREDVFRAFWRAPQPRSLRIGGVGLGMTIARDMTRAHGGDIILGDSESLGGLKVTVLLPQ